MADVYALCRGVIKTIQERDIKVNHCQRELLARTFSHFFDNLENTFRKDHTKDDCLRMCAKALSELWRVLSYADMTVAEWADENWWRSVMYSSVSGSLQMHMNLLLQNFVKCLDIAKIAIAEATKDHTFKLPIMDHSQFFAAVVEEAHKRDNQTLGRSVEAFKESKTFLQRRYGSSYKLAKYLLRKFQSYTPTPETRRYYSIRFRYIEITQGTHKMGSVGTVCECKCFGMPAIAKCLNLTDEKSIKVMEEQVEVFARLQHVNLVQFIGYTVHENQQMLIMERGSANLETYLKRHGSKPVSHLKAFDILLQIAEGMRYLHDQNVIHGDLKATDIILDATERKDNFSCVRVKLADYGLSKLRQSMRPSSATYSNPMAWRPPEVYDYKSDSIEMYTKYTDVYSFALVMYEILTGLKPYEALSPRDVLPSLLSGWRPVTNTESHCPVYLSTFMQQCWATNPKDRPLFPDICNMLSYCKGVILRHSFPSTLSCVNEYDAEILSSHLGSKWCIQEGAKGTLPVEVFSYAVFDVQCRKKVAGAKFVSGVDEVAEVMKAGRYFGNWTSQACDMEKSFKLFRSLNHDYPELLWRLGLCYELGMGVGKCESKAISLYEQACNLNFPSAYIEMGHCYAAGHGVAMNIEMAKRNWTNALLHQTKSGTTLLGIQELLQNLSTGTRASTFDADSAHKAMAARLQELTKHEIGRLLVNGPDSCNALVLRKISKIQAKTSANNSKSPASSSSDSSILKHVVDNPLPQPLPQLPQQTPQHSRIVLLKGSGHTLKKKYSRHPAGSAPPPPSQSPSPSSSSSTPLVIAIAFLCIILAVLVKYYLALAALPMTCAIHATPTS
uniref:Protein kinase domain-containing protein n=1 Tax=Physcomitrium patens TaxID=3218 RepID=A0A2K1IRN5_PHYPA|nr:hypothetical protein PHYPA_026066 [Physcomitrium patens]